MVLYDAEPSLAVLDTVRSHRARYSGVGAQCPMGANRVLDMSRLLNYTINRDRTTDIYDKVVVGEQKQAVKNAWWKNYSTKTKLLLDLSDVRGVRGTCVLNQTYTIALCHSTHYISVIVPYVHNTLHATRILTICNVHDGIQRENMAK